MRSTRSAIGRSVIFLFAVILAGILKIEAAWIDPDFSPSYGFGFGDDTKSRVGTVMSDGRMIVSSIKDPEAESIESMWDRLLLNGAIDPDFDPSLEGLIRIQSPSFAQLSGWYDEADPQLVWLDDDGRRTEVIFRFDEDTGGRFFPYPGDRHLLFGNFTSVNGITRYRLARINADGTVDLSFDAGLLTHEVDEAVALADGKVLLRGRFQEIGGLSVPGLARLNANGTVDPSFVPDAPAGAGAYSGPVVEDSEGRILRSFGGAIYRSPSDGQDSQLLVEFSPENVLPRGLMPMENGAFLVWGNFTEIGGMDRAFLAVINGDGTVDTGFDANAVLATGPRPIGRDTDEIVRLSDGRLVIGGNGIILMPDGSVDPSFRPEQVNPGSVQAVAVQSDGMMVLGGLFTHSGTTVRAGLDRLTVSGLSDPTFDPGQGSTVTEIASIAVGSDGSIWVGGGPTDLPSVPGAVLARHEGDGAVDPNFNLAFNQEARVRTVAVDSIGRVTFGGRFTTVDGQMRNGLARLNLDHSLDTGFADGTALTGQEVEVYHVEILSNGDILVAGNFDAWRGQRRWGLLKLDQNGGLKSDFVPNEALAGLRVTAAAGHDDGSVAVSALNGDSRPLSTIHLLDALGQEIISMPSAVTGYADVSVAVAISGGTTVFSVVPRSYHHSGANSQYRPFLLTLKSDGTKNPSLMPEVDSNEITDMVVLPDGGMVMVGDFDGVDGLDYSGAAKVSDLTDPFTPRMGDISTRGQILGGGRNLIAGFVIEGTEPQRVMIRGVGPTLQDFGIVDPVKKPSLTVIGDPDEPPLFEGGFWWVGDRYTISPDSRIVDMADRVGAFPLTDANPVVTKDLDAVVILDLLPGAYTVQMFGQESGIGLVEVYNATGIEAERRIVNLSTRGWVGVDDDRILGGFVIDGGTKRVLIRAVGPALGDFGVTDHLEDPHLRVVRTKSIEEVGANDNWEDGGSSGAIIEATEIVGAFPLAPGSKDAALILELEPDAYSAIVSGVDRTTGVALVEVYELP